MQTLRLDCFTRCFFRHSLKFNYIFPISLSQYSIQCINNALSISICKYINQLTKQLTRNKHSRSNTHIFVCFMLCQQQSKRIEFQSIIINCINYCILNADLSSFVAIVATQTICNRNENVKC